MWRLLWKQLCWRTKNANIVPQLLFISTCYISTEINILTLKIWTFYPWLYLYFSIKSLCGITKPSRFLRSLVTVYFLVRFWTQLERYILKQPHQSQSVTLNLWHFEIRHWLREFYFSVRFNFKYSILCSLLEAKKQLLIRNITGRCMLLSPFNIQNTDCFKTKFETKLRHLHCAMKWHQYVVK